MVKYSTTKIQLYGQRHKMSQNLRTQSGCTPLHVRLGRQVRVVEPCSRYPFWHLKKMMLPTCFNRRHNTELATAMHL